MIVSTKNEIIKDIMKLKQKKYRDEWDAFLVEGYHLVEEAKQKGVVLCVITTQDESYDYKTLQVSSQVMEKLAFTKTPQPIMAICKKVNHQELNVHGHRYLLLDRVQDPGNVGTMMRTALALGYDQMILSKDCVDLFNDKVIRSTQGALFQMNVCVMDLKEAITSLQAAGVGVYGTCLQNASCIDTYTKEESMGFVMGNEGQGVNRDILNLCDHRIYIPIQGIESLNVAIAAAMTMYHFR